MTLLVSPVNPMLLNILSYIIEPSLNKMGLLVGVVPSDFPLVVLWTTTIFSYHLWCMLGGSV